MLGSSHQAPATPIEPLLHKDGFGYTLDGSRVYPDAFLHELAQSVVRHLELLRACHTGPDSSEGTEDFLCQARSMEAQTQRAGE